MNVRLFISGLLLVTPLALLRAQTPAADAATLAEAAKVQVQVQLPPKGLNHRLTPVVTISTNELGQLTQSTNSYWHLETGIHYQDDQGELQPSVAAFEVKASKVTAETLQHKVRLDANINTKGSVAVVLPDGTKLRSHVSGLRYSDPTTGKAVVISEVKDSQAYLVSSNQVVYFDAFKDVSADVRYTVTLAGLEQDILLHEAPPAPESYGMSSATSRLEVLTEFVNPPSAKKLAKRGQRLPEGLDRPLETMTRTEQEDVAVDFGSMRIGDGRAFRSDTQNETPIGVGKSWLVADKREFLVEAVEMQITAPMLQGLPVRKKGAGLRSKTKLGASPKLQAANQAIPKSPLETSQRMTAQKGWPAGKPRPTEARQPELVLDYVSMITPVKVTQSIPDFTFQGDQTYYIAGNFFLSGTTTIEGGAVLKFAKYVNSDPPLDVSLWIGGNLVCNTSPYRPAVFTACDDNTVGVSLPSDKSTGTVDPGAIYGVRALACWYGAPAWDVHDIRFSGQAYALYLGNQANNKIHNVQIVSRGWAWTAGIQIVGNPGTVPQTPYTEYIGNVLFSSLGTAIGYQYPVSGTVTLDFENVTSDNNYYFCPTTYYSKFKEVRIKNSLLGPVWTTDASDVQMYPGKEFVNLGGNQVVSDRATWSTIFTTALAGKFYLPDSSNIHGTATGQGNPILFSDLSTGTTYAPQSIASPVPDGTILRPRVPRDSVVSDPGYHYPALDYVVSNLLINANAGISLLDGVSVGWSGLNAFTLNGGSRFVSQGLAEQNNHIVHHSLVQDGVRVGTAPQTIFAGQITSGTTLGLTLVSTEFGSLSRQGNQVISVASTAKTGSTHAAMIPFVIQHCRFGAMDLQYAPETTSYDVAPEIGNNLFERGSVFLSGRGLVPAGSLVNAEMRLRLWNNLFYFVQSPPDSTGVPVSQISLVPASPATRTWTITDNLFDGLLPAKPSSVPGVIDYNGFSGSAGWKTPNEKVGAAIYKTGLLGNRYQSNPIYENAGYRTAAAAGLAHYTTRTDQAKDTGQVDIGPHYAAVSQISANSVATVDTDGDGIADYLEDTNGNGVADAGESDFTKSNGLGATAVVIFTPLMP